MASGPPVVLHLLAGVRRWMISSAGGFFRPLGTASAVAVSPPDYPVLPVGVDDVVSRQEAQPLRGNLEAERRFPPLHPRVECPARPFSADYPALYAVLHPYAPFPPEFPPDFPPDSPPVFPPVFPPTCPPAFPPVFPPMFPPAFPPVFPPMFPPAFPPVFPPVFPPAFPPVSPPSFPPVFPPAFPPAFLPADLHPSTDAYAAPRAAP
ncbi:hypothetical protein ABVT39_008339 [Epinephelus coioides]